MTPDLRREIRRSLAERDTDELLEIWRTDNREEWSDTAFEEIAAILKERTGSVPAQVALPAVEDESIAADADGLTGWEAKALDAPDQPELYDVDEVILLVRLIKRVLIAVIVVNALSGLLGFPAWNAAVAALFGVNAAVQPVLPLLAALAVILNTGVAIAIPYVGLRALSQILRNLMQIEFNSRNGF